MARHSGAFHASPRFSAVSTVAQIFLRTKAFTDVLVKSYSQQPDFNLLAIYLDLNAQLNNDPELVDINALIHENGQTMPSPIDVVAYLQHSLMMLYAACEFLNPFTDIFISHTTSKQFFVVELEEEESVASAFNRLTRELLLERSLSKVLFFAGRVDRHCVEAKLSWSKTERHLYVVVCKSTRGYVLYLKDFMGWLAITDEDIHEVDGFGAEDICLLGYIDDDGGANAIRSPSDTVSVTPVAETTKRFMVIVKTLEPTTMKWESAQTSFATREECMDEISRASENYSGLMPQIYFQIDDENQISMDKPTETSFHKSITMYIEITRAVHSLIPAYLESEGSIDLEIECYLVSAIALNVAFERRQTAGDVVEFCKRLVDEVLELEDDQVKVFCRNDEGYLELRDGSVSLSVVDIKDSGGSIVFSVDDQTPIPCVTMPAAQVSPPPHVSPTLTSSSLASSSSSIKVKVVEAVKSRRVEERGFTVKWSVNLTASFLLSEAMKNSTHTKLELYAVSPDGLSLEKVDGAQRIARGANNLSVYRKRLSNEKFCPLALLQSSNPVTPTGIVYWMPIDGTHIENKDPSKSQYGIRKVIETFLGVAVGEVGLLAKDKTKMRSGKLFLYEIESSVKCFYAVAAQTIKH